jgi:hypothetical protein
MALNPATTTGTGGWGLAPVGTASQSTMPLAPVQPTLTPEQIAQLRQQSVAMQTPPTQNIQSWTQGVAELVRAMQGNREADFARQQELQGRQQGADAIGKIYAPYLSQGGSSPSAAGAAPAGTLGSGPAGATASADNPAPSDTNTPAATADASAPRGIRNNNPLNIEDGQFARGQPGYAGSDGRFAKFETPEHGVSAADKLLNSYQANQGLNTINGIVGRWAPSTDGNNTKAYAAHVAAQMGIGPNDPIPPAMRPQLIAAMAAHENGIPLPPAATKVPQAAPTGLLAPIQPPGATPAAPVAPPPSPAAPSPTPTQLAYAGTGPIPPGMVPNPVTQGAQGQPASPPGMAPMVNAIAGRPMPPAAPTAPPVTPVAPPIAPPDFVRQAAAMEAAKASAPQAPLPSPGAAIPPADFAAQVAAMEAAKGAPNQPASGTPPIAPADFAKMAATMEAMKAGGPPPSVAAVPPTGASAPPVQTAAIPPTAAATPPTTPLPPAVLPSGSAIPGAIGPTSVNGAPLAIPPPFGATSVNGAPLPQRGTPPTNAAPLVNAIAGQNLPPNAAPTAGTGSPIPGAPPQVAQNGPPPGAAPSPAGGPAGGPAGLPSPLTSPTGQVTQAQLTQVLANPWVPESAKASMLQMIQQRGQPQSMPVEGGTLMFNAAGQKVFIPEPKMGTVKIGGAEIPTVSHFDPASGRWNTQTLAPGGGVQTGAPSSDAGGPMPHPAQAQGGTPQPDLSTIGGIQAAEAAQAGAKKGAETSAETSAKYYDSLHKGLAGSAMIASQQKQNIDALRQIASSPDFISGAFGDSALQMQRFAAQLGINPTGAAPRELFNQLAAKVLADQFSGLKSMASETGEAGGRVFKPMLDIEEKANVTSDDTPAGISAKLNLLDNAGNLMMKYGDMADDYVAKNGKLDAGFDKSLRGEIAKSRLPNVVPQPETGAAASAPVTKAIGGKTYYQIGGKWFDNPDGK